MSTWRPEGSGEGGGHQGSRAGSRLQRSPPRWTQEAGKELEQTRRATARPALRSYVGAGLVSISNSIPRVSQRWEPPVSSGRPASGVPLPRPRDAETPPDAVASRARTASDGVGGGHGAPPVESRGRVHTHPRRPQPLQTSLAPLGPPRNGESVVAGVG